MLSEEQKKKLHSIIQRLSEVQADLCDAYETTLMSEAKSSVHGLLNEVKEDSSLDPIIKTQLIGYLDAAWYAVITDGTTYTRASNSQYKVAQAEAYLKKIL